MSGETVVQRKDGPVTWITLARPERLNAFAGDMRERLADAIESAGADDSRSIVITGAGRAFCAGADVDVMRQLVSAGDERTLLHLLRAGARVVRAIHTAGKPVIAALGGVAAGAGASLAVACDLRIASERAAIGFTFGRIGLHPDWGATHFLPRAVGPARAAELVLSSRLVDATEALRLGLVHEVVGTDDFEARVRDVAGEMARNPPVAVRLARESLRGDPGSSALDAALEREIEAQIACFATRDLRDGLSAFTEKRSPVFIGE